MLKNDQTLCLLFHFHLPIFCVCVFVCVFLQGNEEEFLIGQKREIQPINGWRRIKNHSTLVESTKQMHKPRRVFHSPCLTSAAAIV
jgi:hypothetical protein